MRHGRWKYLRDGETEFLFDLAADPGERKNLYESSTEKARELRKLLQDWEADVDTPAPPFRIV